MDVFDRFSFHRGFAEWAGLHDRLPFLFRTGIRLFNFVDRNLVSITLLFCM
jgi:hypothetical protein